MSEKNVLKEYHTWLFTQLTPSDANSRPRFVEADSAVSLLEINYFQDAMNWHWGVFVKGACIKRGTTPDRETAREAGRDWVIGYLDEQLAKLKAARDAELNEPPVFELGQLVKAEVGGKTVYIGRVTEIHTGALTITCPAIQNPYPQVAVMGFKHCWPLTEKEAARYAAAIRQPATWMGAIIDAVISGD